MQPVTPPVIVANAHSGLRAVLGYREIARLALLNNPEPLLWTKCAFLISSFHLIPMVLIRSPMLQFMGVVTRAGGTRESRGARERCGATKFPDVVRANLDKTFIPNYELRACNSTILFNLLAIRAFDMPKTSMLSIALAAIALCLYGI